MPALGGLTGCALAIGGGLALLSERDADGARWDHPSDRDTVEDRETDLEGGG